MQAKIFASYLSNAVWTNQLDNTANSLAHYETTGPEIWKQTSMYVCIMVWAYVCDRDIAINCRWQS